MNLNLPAGRTSRTLASSDLHLPACWQINLEQPLPDWLHVWIWQCFWCESWMPDGCTGWMTPPSLAPRLGLCLDVPPLRWLLHTRQIGSRNLHQPLRQLNDRLGAGHWVVFPYGSPTKCRSHKRRMDKTSNDKTSNGTHCWMPKCRMRQNVERTKYRMGQNTEET